MDLATAQRHAEKIMGALSPMCDRIEVSGSIRRQRETCNDIDIVVLPHYGLQRKVRERCLQTCPEIRQDGDCNLSFVLHGGVQVDVWFATHPRPDMFQPQPSTFGTRLLCRTGSRQFNIWFATQAVEKGFKWNPYWGLYRETRCVAAESEADMFRVLDLEYIQPEDRER